MTTQDQEMIARLRGSVPVKAPGDTLVDDEEYRLAVAERLEELTFRPAPDDGLADELFVKLAATGVSIEQAGKIIALVNAALRARQPAENECPACVGTGTVQTQSDGPPTFGFAPCPSCGEDVDAVARAICCPDGVCAASEGGPYQCRAQHTNLQKQARAALAAMPAPAITEAMVERGAEGILRARGHIDDDFEDMLTGGVKGQARACLKAALGEPK